MFESHVRVPYDTNNSVADTKSGLGHFVILLGQLSDAPSLQHALLDTLSAIPNNKYVGLEKPPFRRSYDNVILDDLEVYTGSIEVEFGWPGVLISKAASIRITSGMTRRELSMQVAQHVKDWLEEIKASRPVLPHELENWKPTNFDLRLNNVCLVGLQAVKDHGDSHPCRYLVCLAVGHKGRA